MSSSQQEPCRYCCPQTNREVEPNVADPALLARNWKALWRTLADLPHYATHLRGRVFADLVNEPRWAWGGGVSVLRVCHVA
jgi:hypothetical protein